MSGLAGASRAARRSRTRDPAAVGIAVVVLGGLGLAAEAASAQPAIDRRVADEPTGGIELPATPLAGEGDARGVVANPAGLQFLRGTHLTLAMTLTDDEDAAGRGFGVFMAKTLDSPILPRLGFGIGLEAVRSRRALRIPDPGTPLRLSMSQSLPLGRSGAIGLAWHHFFDDGALRGLDTYDLGVAWRIGAHVGGALVVRDLAEPRVGGAPVQRRYEGELVARPFGTARLELAAGGRIGEIRGDLDGWGRISWRVLRGVFLHGAIESQALTVIETVGADRVEREERELRWTAGLEISLGPAGVTTYGTASTSDGGTRLASTTTVARFSSEQVPGILRPASRIERIELSGKPTSRQITSWLFTLRAIERDPAVKAVVVSFDGLDAGWASLEEIRAAFLAMRRRGKKVFAYLVASTGRDYWVATAADKIYIDPAGGLRLAGLSGSTLYFKGLFDKVGVKAQFERIAEWKSAPEAFTETGPTAPASQMRNQLYGDLWQAFVAGIAEARHLDAEVVEGLIDGGPFSSGDLAADEDHRLVDAVIDPDGLSDLIIKELGGAYPVGSAPRDRPERWSTPAIAVIHADGDIVDGKSSNLPVVGRRLVGSETLVEAIAAARASPEIAAIVLRIDSPGGSALASEMMAREVFKTRGVKPVICSLGDTAASGGYFLAAGCDVIFAGRMTITGSIGIFYGKFDLSGLLAKLGVTSDTFRRGQRADMESFLRPYTDDERKHVAGRIAYYYDRFVRAVAEGRGISPEAVDLVGRGRVWTGSQAKAKGLVDRLGGVVDAIQLAKAHAGYDDDDDVRIIELPLEGKSLLQRILGGAGLASREPPSFFAEALAAGIPASVLVNPSVPQARLPFEIVWH